MLSVQKDRNTASDEALIREYQESGDKELIGELFNRYYHLAYGTCLKVLKNKTESSDLVVVIFEKMIEKLRRVEVHHFNSWLYSFCRNECVNYIRRQQLKRRKTEAWVEQHSQGEVSMANEEILQLCEQELLEEEQANQEEDENRRRVRKALRKLTREQRICISLFFFKGKSYQQIAEKTTFSLAQVKSYLQNGKRNLKKMLEDTL